MSIRSRMAAIERTIPKQGKEIPNLFNPDVRTKLINKYKGLIGEECFNRMRDELKLIPFRENDKKLEVIRKYY
ncbi:hypothetical protein SPSIL_017080 [Sporomusa silvacetica DSM 10669]|uniref:Uncharacterized protein n=1 Tax=Sporomusa silvacetica DSM 10669 TaxID=1123289 RepID=A0ABZ3IJK0_9FIRM|nr:hypothetical protein [Sporomusa silvacetica]OZC18361.1 hypothetical protein SPSIL_25610 [Sporomusa silvacetica DSM 10669]